MADASDEMPLGAAGHARLLQTIQHLADMAVERVTELKARNNALELTNARMMQEDHKAAAVVEIQDARKALVEGFLKYRMISKESLVIGIKWMGELEEAPFKDACMRKYGNEDDPEAKASILFSVWQDELKNPSWHPFKTVQVDGKTQEVLDEDDAKLTQLQNEYGDDVCSAVKMAVGELLGYNPAEGYPVPEVWNFDEGRRATTAEALKCVFDHLNK